MEPRLNSSISDREVLGNFKMFNVSIMAFHDSLPEKNYQAHVHGISLFNFLLCCEPMLHLFPLKLNPSFEISSFPLNQQFY